MQKATGISRRDFIKGVAAGAVTLGVMGNSPLLKANAAEVDSEDTGAWLSADNGMFDWRTRPEEPSEFVQTYEADVIICGAGLSGLTAARRAAELGNTVIVLETDDNYDIHGFQCATVNSQMIKDAGCEIDTMDFFYNYMAQHMNRCNPDVIRTWIDNSGPAFDWYEELLPERGDDYETNYRSVIYEERPDDYSTDGHKYKTYRGTIDFTYESWAYGGSLLYSKTEELGVEYHFNERGYMLTTDGAGRITGIISKIDNDGDITYNKYTANKGVIISTGYHGTAQDIMMEIGVEEAVYTLRNGEDFPAFSGFGGSGDGHRMLVWEGADIEPFRQADGNSMALLDPVASLSLNANGMRWHNEDDQCWTLGLEMRWQPGKMAWKIYDKNWRESLPYQNTSHMAIDPYASTPWTVPPAGYFTLADGETTTDGETNYLDYLEQEMLAGVGNPDGITIGNYWTWQGDARYGAETLDELADMMGYDEEAKANMMTEIEEYNGLCEQGKDTRYGKASQMLFPIKEGPFFAFSSSTKLSGRMGQEGIITNGRLQPINVSTGKPLEGVYLAGVVVGGRHACCYMTPMGGMNHGFDITFGKCSADFLTEDNQ